MKRRDEVFVGILITIAVSVAIVGTLWLARGGLSAGYPLYTVFEWGAGLKQGQPVLLSGVNVGYVGDIDLRPNGTLVVTLRIDNEYGIPEGSTAVIEPYGYFGDVLVALHPLRPTTDYIPRGDTIPAGRSAVAIKDIIARVDTMSRALSDVTHAVEVQLVQQGGIADLRQTIASTNRLVAQLGVIATEQSRQLSATLATLRRTVGAIDSTSVDSTLQNLEATSRNMVALTAGLQQTTAELNAALGRLNDTTGTAGRLLNDPRLYDDMTRLVTRLDSLTADFKRNPRRYINLEIF